MTQFTHTGHVLKAYYVGHNAARRDLEIIQKFLKLAPQEREQKMPQFARWFRLHAQMWGYDFLSTNEYLFPAIGGHMPDGEAFLSYSRDRYRDGTELHRRIFGLLEEGKYDAELIRFLNEHVTTALKYLEHHEALFLPVILENYTKELNKQVDRAFVKRIGLSGLSLLLPWMLTRATPEDARAFLHTFPAPVRWLYAIFWEPRFKKQYPPFLETE